MQIFVRFGDGATKTFDIDMETTVLELREKVANSFSIDLQYVQLIYGGKQLEDEYTLGRYDMVSESTLQLIQRFRGGL